LIQFKLEDHEVMETTNGGWRPSYKLNLSNWKWYAEWDDDGKVSYLGCRDADGNVRFKWGEDKVSKEKRLEAEAKEAKEEAA
jgi:hypothetical protein